MRASIFLSLIVLLLAAACKKKPITHPTTGARSADTSYTPTPAPIPGPDHIDTFIGTFSTWGKATPNTEVYVENNRLHTHITGNMVVKFWALSADHIVNYQVKGNAAYATISISRSSYHEAWASIRRHKKDSILIDWYYAEEIYAKGPTGGWHTEKEASFAGKIK